MIVADLGGDVRQDGGQEPGFAASPLQERLRTLCSMIVTEAGTIAIIQRQDCLYERHPRPLIRIGEGYRTD